ncbi:methionine adenosyltransferase [Candidatus Saccharibacteria bacterium]|nr:methionine adenosyltransferase [Candidatus Saccharibacteria bacterium]
MSHSTFTSESVCAGHPDKIADQISDAILDAVLADDPTGRVAVETAVTKDRIILFGELTTTARLDFVALARAKVRQLGYTHPEWGFSDQSPVEVYLQQQSPEIAQGVDDNGAGDQGMMFGYATNETVELLPLPIVLAHALTRALDEVQSTTLPYLRPDGKAQVTVIYDHDKPIGIQQVTIAKPHDESQTLEHVKSDLYRHVITPVLARYGHKIAESHIIVNGTGVWHHPGPAVDAGLTGRKIVVDGYGGYARVGGGAFSGKDPSKVDRSGAYAARYLAKHIVAAGLATRAEVSLAYFIGAKQSVATEINTFGTGTVPDADIKDFADRLLDTSVKGIVTGLNLLQPIYAATAAYGHFGKSDLPWERTASATTNNNAGAKAK